MSKKSQKEAEAIEKRTQEILAEKPKSRNDLMLKVKSMGIKQFRVMNKAELLEVLSATPERIAEIQKTVVERWKSGFGKRKSKVEQPIDKP